MEWEEENSSEKMLRNHKNRTIRATAADKASEEIRDGTYDTTINLVLASAELADSTVKCVVHRTEHGSDHRAIEAVFDILVPVPKQQERLLLKNAPWKEINSRSQLGIDNIFSELNEDAHLRS